MSEPSSLRIRPDTRNVWALGSKSTFLTRMVSVSLAVDVVVAPVPVTRDILRVVLADRMSFGWIRL